jgi:hypothetical protein
MQKEERARGSLANFSGALRRAIGTGTIGVGINCSRGNSPASPVYKPYGQAVAFFGSLLPFLIYLIDGQWAMAGLFLLLWCLFVILALGRVVHWRVRRDVMRLIHEDDLAIETLWSCGILMLTYRPTGETATSPDDDWRKFLARTVLVEPTPPRA